MRGWKRTALSVPLLILALVTIAVAGYVVWTWTVQVTVQEPFQVTSDLPESFSMHAGETKTYTVTVKNHASVALTAKLDYREVENPDGVDYQVTIKPSKEQTVGPGSTVNFAIEIKVKGDSPPGTFKLEFRLERKDG